MTPGNLGPSLYRYAIPDAGQCSGRVTVDGFCRTQGAPVVTNTYGPGVAAGVTRSPSVVSDVVLLKNVPYARSIAVKASDARAARTPLSAERR
jgi:hypothetical protein